ncbi:MAG: heme oxygenase (biliverdin-producing) [Actinomycetota bacterium]|nr:biliverdin-producing heme oxygenase [Actinomycetota bacterium]
MTESTEPLSKVMFGGSAVIHRQAERRPFMVVFFKSELPREAYVEYLGRLSYVYEAIEDADEALRDDPVVGRMYSPELHRRDAIDRDMTFFAGPNWRDGINVSPATQAYVDRIQTVEKEFRPGFVPHQWLRYLGNVLAQPVLQRILTKAYGLEDAGMDFVRYPQVGDPRAYLGSYHERMNSMPLDEAARQAVVDEANRAWALQIAFTDELAADFGIVGPGEEETEKFLQGLAADHP